MLIPTLTLRFKTLCMASGLPLLTRRGRLRGELTILLVPGGKYEFKHIWSTDKMYKSTSTGFLCGRELLEAEIRAWRDLNHLF